jgi:N-acetyl-alpha-D-muramate 1-phosphate uridylyltransferase
MVVMPAIMPQPGKRRPSTATGPSGDAGVCAVVLAAGEGRKLRPLTLVRPKPLCPVGGTPLLDLALARARTATPAVAVNVHHQRERIEEHLATGADRGADGAVGIAAAGVQVSVEEGEALGTAGALAHLRDWIGGRGVLVLNSDTWAPGDLAGVTKAWDSERVQVLVAGDDHLHHTSRVAGAWMPWSEVVRLRPEPSGLWEVSWRARLAEGRVAVVRWDGPCLDCGTPARYLAANMAASGGAPVIGEGAVVDGVVDRAVVWDGARVRRGEELVDGIRAGDGVTVLVR